MTIELKEHERLDDLQNGYFIIQNTQDFCYGIDAVLLSGFARVKPGRQERGGLTKSLGLVDADCYLQN